MDCKARLVIASHLGRPKGSIRPEYSLRPVAVALEAELKRPVRFCPTAVGDIAKAAIDQVEEGECILLENLRFHAGEEENDPYFCKEMASNVDMYVNDAFGTVHRAHASTEGLARLFDDPACGYLIVKELEALDGILSGPGRPSTAVIGGAKVKDKIGLLESLLKKQRPPVDRRRDGLFLPESSGAVRRQIPPRRRIRGDG